MDYKLYVWANPYHVSHGTSGLFVVARSISEARDLAKKAPKYEYVEYGQGEIDFSKIELGEPTRIVQLPCAEWHEWSE